MKQARGQRLLNQHIVASIDKKTFKYLYIRWIAIADLFFAQVKNNEFRVFL